MKKTIISIMLSLVFGIIMAGNSVNASVRKASVEELTKGSEHLIIGKVADIYYQFTDPNNKEIYTFVVLDVHQSIKGNFKEKTLVLKFPGGIVGNFRMWVEHTPRFFISEEVVVFVITDNSGEFSVMGWEQGKFTVENNNITINGNRITVSDFILPIQSFINAGEKGKINFKFEKKKSEQLNNIESVRVVPSISSISPNSGSAVRPYAINPNNPFNPGDRGTITDIYGSNFGSTQGSSVVRFYERLNSPFNPSTVHVDAEDILLWSDTQIKCKVPGRQDFNHASSNPVNIITSAGTSNSVQFNVPFVSRSKWFINLPITYYINENGTPDCGSEFSEVQAAFQTWEDVVFSTLDYNYAGNTTNGYGYDGDNVCVWIESGWPTGNPFAIAITTAWINDNPSSNYMYEFDIRFNGEYNTWSCSGEANKKDVRNVATHEAGHTFGLLDLYGTSDTEKTMYGGGGNGVIKQQTLEPDDIAGTRYVYPNTYTLNLQNDFDFGDTGGQIKVENVSQGTNTVTYSVPLAQTVSYGTTYQLDALTQQTTNGRDYRFIRWSDGQLNNIRSFSPTSNKTYTSEYHWHLKSHTSLATAYNNGRHIIKDNSNKYHLVYEDNEEIYYTSSTDDGSTWSGETLISDGNGNNKYPSIDVDYNGNYYIVWQQYNIIAGDYFIRYKSTSSSIETRGNSTKSNVSPVIAVKGSSPFDKVVLWNDGSRLVMKYYTVNSVWETVNVPNTNGSCDFPSIAYDQNTSSWKTHISWQKYGEIYYYQMHYYYIYGQYFIPQWRNYKCVSCGFSLYDSNGYASISISSDHKPEVSWDAFLDDEEGGQVILHRKKSSTNGTSWSSITEFFGGDGVDYYYPSICSHSNSNNDISIVWNKGTGSAARVYLAGRTNGSWGSPSDKGQGRYPNITTGSYDAMMAWGQGGSSPYTIVTSSSGLPRTSTNRTNHVYYRREDINLSEVVLPGDGLINMEGSLNAALGEILLVSNDEDIPIEFLPVPNSLSNEHYLVTNSFTVSSQDQFLQFRYRIKIQDFDINITEIPDNILNVPLVRLLLRDVQSGNDITELGNLLFGNLIATGQDTMTVQGVVNIPLSGLIGEELYLSIETARESRRVPLITESYHIDVDQTSRALVPKINEIEIEVPDKYSLSQNFPNPFNPTTTIQYEIPQRSEVQVIIYNVLGREITTLVSEIQEAGFKSIQWDASDVESGIYFYQVRAEGFVQTRKMILLK